MHKDFLCNVVFPSLVPKAVAHQMLAANTCGSQWRFHRVWIEAAQEESQSERGRVSRNVLFRRYDQ